MDTPKKGEADGNKSWAGYVYDNAATLAGKAKDAYDSAYDSVSSLAGKVTDAVKDTVASMVTDSAPEPTIADVLHCLKDLDKKVDRVLTLFGKKNGSTKTTIATS